MKDKELSRNMHSVLDYEAQVTSVTQTSSGVRQELEEPGEIWLKLSISSRIISKAWGYLTAPGETAHQNTRGQRTPMVKQKGRSELPRWEEQLRNKRVDEKINGPLLRNCF